MYSGKLLGVWYHRRLVLHGYKNDVFKKTIRNGNRQSPAVDPMLSGERVMNLGGTQNG